MEFFDKLGKKASEAYKVTADKTGKLAKEAKIRMKINEMKGQIKDIYVEIGKKVYEKHVREEEIDIKKDLEDECTRIDVLTGEIEDRLKECLDLKDKKQCPKCFKEIEKDMKFCPECGTKQEEKEEIKEVEVVENKENLEESANQDNTISENFEEQEEQTDSQINLEKTTEVEINPDPQDITEEEMKNIGM